MGWKGLMIGLFLLPMLVLPAFAGDVLWRQEDTFGVGELEQAADRLDGTARLGDSLDDGLRELFRQGSEAAEGVLRRALRSGVLLMVVVMLCGFGDTMLHSAGGSRVPVVALVGTLAVTALAAADVTAMLGLGKETIGKITSFANVLFPVVAAVTAATGAVTGAAVRQTAATLFSGVLVNLIDGLLVPLLYGYLAACVAHAAVGNEGLKRLSGLLKHTATTILTAVMLLFVGYLTVSGVVAGSADAMSIKATKFAISGAIPVVGGILSDASETILASAGVLRGSVGVFGAITVLSLCLLPVMKIAAHYLMYKLAATLAATVGPSPVCTLVDGIGSAFGLMLGMTGACCLLLLIALVSSITAVSV